VRNTVGPLAGTALGLLLVALPEIQVHSGALMAETLLALVSFSAVLSLGRFLDSGSRRDATAFGIWVSLALLTKGTALAFVLVPPLAVLLGRRWHLLARPAFWWMAVPPLVLCGPWYWLTLSLQRYGATHGSLSLWFTTFAVRYYTVQSVLLLGFVPTVLAALGFAGRAAGPLVRGTVPGKWAASTAFLLGLGGFLCVVPWGPFARYLIPALPVLFLFLAEGIALVASWLPLPRSAARTGPAVVTLATLLAFAVGTFTIPKNHWYGHGAAAERLLADANLKQSVFLVSSDPEGEGMFIAAVAQREQRPGHVVLRASKVLALTDWTGDKYSPVYETPAEVMDFLEEVPVGIVVIDQSAGWGDGHPHHQQLVQAIQAHPQRWELLGSFRVVRDGEEYPDAIKVFRLVGHESRSRGKISIPMEVLQRTLELRR
jgi:hypothetical protein